jgi:hypothetical protein
MAHLPGAAISSAGCRLFLPLMFQASTTAQKNHPRANPGPIRSLTGSLCSANVPGMSIAPHRACRSLGRQAHPSRSGQPSSLTTGPGRTTGRAACAIGKRAAENRWRP